ncbi:hypothetical protein PO379_05585 [Enterobacter asburiae]|nr:MULTISPECIES: hypothetical protein [Enterobacteriaceae]MDI3141720.1 hypothetical protein [Enterobacter kobei]MDQ9156135.1 hypothetical protein [Citrobacter portucalensis]
MYTIVSSLPFGYYFLGSNNMYKY